MAFTAYVPTPNELVTLNRADGSELLSAATTNVSLEQLADGVVWINGYYARPKTWTALQTFTTSIAFTGPHPTAGADPGANVATALSQSRAWAKISVVLGTVTVNDNYGVSSVTVTSSYVEITFARAFANTHYCPTITGLLGTTFQIYQVNHSETTTTMIRVYVYDAEAGTGINPTSTELRFCVDVKGRQ